MARFAIKKLVRFMAVALFLGGVIVASSGCVIHTADGRRISFRVAQRTSDQVVQQGNGEMQHVEGMAPGGDTLMFFVRGQMP